MLPTAPMLVFLVKAPDCWEFLYNLSVNNCRINFNIELLLHKIPGLIFLHLTIGKILKLLVGSIPNKPYWLGRQARSSL